MSEPDNTAPDLPSSQTPTTTDSGAFQLPDLALHPSDPLNLLLHSNPDKAGSDTNTNTNTMNSDDSSSSSSDSPPDWSQLTNLWPAHDDPILEPTKPTSSGTGTTFPDLMDFSDLTSLPMDMDFNPAMAVDPSALTYDYFKHSAALLGSGIAGVGVGGFGMGTHFGGYDDMGYGMSSHASAMMATTEAENSAAATGATANPVDLTLDFPFTFHPSNASSSSAAGLMEFSYPPPSPSLVDSNAAVTRRLSIISSSSSSGLSLSPVISSAQASSSESTPATPSSASASSASSNASPTSAIQPHQLHLLAFQLHQQQQQQYANDPAAELAQRVRETAGVMLAVPMAQHLAGMPAQPNFSEFLVFFFTLHYILHLSTLRLYFFFPHSFRFSLECKSNLSNYSDPSHLLSQAQASASGDPHSQLPRRPFSTSTSSVSKAGSPEASSSSAASTPPPSTPPLSTTSIFGSAADGDALAGNTTETANGAATMAVQPTAASGRPKTSHTTIERRYRTNLNARIQSLRMAVPALRVLEDRDALASAPASSSSPGDMNDIGTGKKGKARVSANAVIRGIKNGGFVLGGGVPGLNGVGVGGVGPDGMEVIDVIDERGYVDGVKVARKCSKANVLGKAVEYIRYALRSPLLSLF